MKHIYIILLIGFADMGLANGSIDITNPSQVNALYQLQENLDSVSTVIMQCIDSGETHHACMCKHRELIIQFNTFVDNLFSNHPDLNQYDLVTSKSPNGVYLSQSLESIRKQAGTVPSCI